jgi:hypothetical protein
LADANFALLKRDPRHPSLQFKRVGDTGLPASGYGIVHWLSKSTTSMFGSGLALTLIMIG